MQRQRDEDVRTIGELKSKADASAKEAAEAVAEMAKSMAEHSALIAKIGDLTRDKHSALQRQEEADKRSVLIVLTFLSALRLSLVQER